MAEKNNATCSICGNDYHMCLSCRDSMKLAPWKVHTDTAEHYKIFQIVRGFSTGVFTKEEAKMKFKNVDLTDMESFRPHIKEIIKDILKEPIVESIDEIEPMVVEKENLVIEKPIISRKRNYRANNKIEEIE